MIGINALNEKGIIIPIDMEISSLEKAQEILKKKNLTVDPVLTLKNYFDRNAVDKHKKIIYASKFIYQEDFCRVIKTIRKLFDI